MAAAKKIRLTLLWADRAAVEMDQGYSETLVKWATAFFKRHGLELDVRPKPGGSLKDHYPYALVEKDGFSPDVATMEEIVSHYARVVTPVTDEFSKVSAELRELFDKILDDERAVAQALQQFGSLPPPLWPAQAPKLLSAFAELVAHRVQHELKDQRWKELLFTIDSINQLYAFERKAQQFDRPARLAIGDKIIESSMPDTSSGTPQAKTGPAQDIRAEDRLLVVFCRFQLSPGLAKSPGPQPFGITTTPNYPNTANGRYMYERPVVFINILRQERITLAHEVVHAAGDVHPPDQQQLKNIARLIADVVHKTRFDPVKKVLVLPDFYETVPGGFFDGPRDDIMNYHSKGMDPGKVGLADKKLFDSAFFSRPP